MIYPLDYIRITQYPHKNNNLSVDFGKERKVSKTPILACDDGVVKNSLRAGEDAFDNVKSKGSFESRRNP